MDGCEEERKEERKEKRREERKQPQTLSVSLFMCMKREDLCWMSGGFLPSSSLFIEWVDVRNEGRRKKREAKREEKRKEDTKQNHRHISIPLFMCMKRERFLLDTRRMGLLPSSSL